MNLSRREFLGASAVALIAARTQDAEPIIDIHQHTGYGGKRDKTGKGIDPGRTDEQLRAHQNARGVARTVLLPAGSEVLRPSTHQGSANGLQGTCTGNEACENLAKA